VLSNTIVAVRFHLIPDLSTATIAAYAAFISAMVDLSLNKILPNKRNYDKFQQGTPILIVKILDG